ncbi:hypothetical protein HOD75_03030 [archaeon]|jgi:hypothetical protein|nr:hypothetical protein [archaeon]MBT4241847.1 hypothetical protein [archaeon]MBT4418394.1 hypothetical protein [archaeon]
MNKANHARRFNSIMPTVNEIWASRVSGLERNPKKGPDLLGDGKFAEVKFVLVKPQGNGKSDYPRAWTVLDHQVEYGEYWNGIGLWALGTYELDRPVQEIKTRDFDELEAMVTKRELWIVNWDWMYQYPVSNCSGSSWTSEWDNSFRYPKLKNLPQPIETYDVEKGLVHLTSDLQKKILKIYW